MLSACVFLLLFFLSSSATANTQQDEQALQAPHPFQAQYRLEIRGWPGATITHTLSNEGLHWLSDMNFSVAVARGEERSRFSIDDSTTRSLLYNSSYSLLGVGDSYQLNESDIGSLDRQAALFDLSRRAGHEGCTVNAPCDIEFVDHRGRDEHFQYYVNAPATISVPAGEFEATRVTLIDREKPDRHLQINFHPNWPGLILSAEYQKEGRRQTYLTMTQFNPAGGNAP
ncbi:hypothetical protein [Vreelandella andesensis]